MKTSVKIFDTVEELAEYFATLLILHIRETPDDREFSWVLSGGTTPKLVFRKIASNFRDFIPWNKVNIFWGDERCVDPEDDDSNFKMAKESLLDHVPIPPSNYFRIQFEADPATEAGRYAELFRKQVKLYQGIPRADLLMLGLGEDGHTASIFPENLQLFNSDKLFEPTEHPDTRQKRITATGKVINRAKLVVMLVTGEAKASRVAQIINRLKGWDQLPAARVRPENGELIWLLDQKTAFKLKNILREPL